MNTVRKYVVTSWHMCTMTKKQYKVTYRGQRVSVSLYEWMWEDSKKTAEEAGVDHRELLQTILDDLADTDTDDVTTTEVVTFALWKITRALDDG